MGCANGHLLATLPRWVSESGVSIEAHSLEFIPSLADLARRLHPELAHRIHTGSVMMWQPPRRYRFVTVLAEASVPLPPSNFEPRTTPKRVVGGSKFRANGS